MRHSWAKGLLGLILAFPLAAPGCGIGIRVGGPGSDSASRSAGEEVSASPRPSAPAPADKPAARGKEEAAIASALQSLQTKQASYRISPADLLDISVFQEADMQRKVRVGPDGIVTLPLIGKVQVGGLGVPDAEAAVTDKLRRFLHDPQVSVFIAEYGNKQVYVLGEVARPGS